MIALRPPRLIDIFILNNFKIFSSLLKSKVNLICVTQTQRFCLLMINLQSKFISLYLPLSILHPFIGFLDKLLILLILNLFLLTTPQTFQTFSQLFDLILGRQLRSTKLNVLKLLLINHLSFLTLSLSSISLRFIIWQLLFFRDYLISVIINDTIYFD